MYLNLYLWLQNTMLTPVLFNSVLKLQVPMIPWEHVIAFSALYCGLYMGGHTVKAIFGDRFATRESSCCRQNYRTRASPGTSPLGLIDHERAEAGGCHTCRYATAEIAIQTPLRRIMAITVRIS
jgi:hypothetical protein